MTINPAFQGHGIMLYDHVDLWNRDNGYHLTAKKIKRMGMSHAWLRVNGRRGVYKDMEKARSLSNRLRDNGIAVAGWGWWQGENYDKDVVAALQGCEDIGANAYVIDAEHLVNQSTIEPDELGASARSLKDMGLDLALSSFALIHPRYHADLYGPCMEHCQVGAPQVYWWTHPNARMRTILGEPDDTLHDPYVYLRYCLDGWERYDKPLCVTGQAYWDKGEYAPWGEDQALGKMGRVVDFLERDGAIDLTNLAGFNWWWGLFKGDSRHGGMSPKMVDYLSVPAVRNTFDKLNPEAVAEVGEDWTSLRSLRVNAAHALGQAKAFVAAAQRQEERIQEIVRDIRDLPN